MGISEAFPRKDPAGEFGAWWGQLTPSCEKAGRLSSGLWVSAGPGVPVWFACTEASVSLTQYCYSRADLRRRLFTEGGEKKKKTETWQDPFHHEKEKCHLKLNPKRVLGGRSNAVSTEGVGERGHVGL